MRILSWNIWQGGGKRVERIVERILGHGPDVVVLTEYRAGKTGFHIGDCLTAAGYTYQYAATEKLKINSVFVASRMPFRDSNTFSELGDDIHRVCEVQLDGLILLACLFPQRHKKIPVFDFVLEWAERNKETPALIVGDLNTGKHFEDEPGADFVGAEYLSRIEEAGFVDGWRLLNGNKREYTWFSNAGNGFRIDHVFANRQGNCDLSRVWYSHEEREVRISDHSVLLIDVLTNGLRSS